MNVDAILLSEYARIMDGNRLMVIGTFNTIGVPELPAVVAMFLSVHVEAHRDERGQRHELEIKVLNVRREAVLLQPFRVPWTFTNDEPFPGMYLTHVQVSGLGLQFSEEGPYSFEVHIDGTYYAATNLYVTLAPPGN